MVYKALITFTSFKGYKFEAGQAISQSEFDDLTPPEQNRVGKEEEDEDQDNAGSLTIMADGHVGMNLGGGLALDLGDGKLGINLGGGISLPL
jgi:hypothetical protein